MDIRSLSGVTHPALVSSEAAVPPTPARTAAAVENVGAVQPLPQVNTATQLSKALENINKMLQTVSPGVEFTVDDENHRTIIKVVDQENKQVLRQIPSEEAIAIANALDKLQGLLIKQTA
jgi:flagellar protein FlaG